MIPRQQVYEPATADAAALLAVLDHELYHCGQKEKDGEPVFIEWTGEPVWELVGHDCELFLGQVERYGTNASGLGALKRAMNSEPLIARTDIDGCCGNHQCH